MENKNNITESVFLPDRSGNKIQYSSAFKNLSGKRYFRTAMQIGLQNG